MALQYFPFLNVSGDREYSDSEFALYYSVFMRTGIFTSYPTQFKINPTKPATMVVTVGAGAANINGRLFVSTAQENIVIATASTTQDRTDSIVIQLDLPNRWINYKYKQGDTTVVRNNSIYELQLATIFVPKNSATVTSDHIRDMRGNSNVCGYATPFDNVPVDGMLEEFRTILENIVAETEASSTANEQAQEQALTNMYSDFQSWFTNLQDELDDNQAANLQSQIDKLKANQELNYIFTHNLAGYPPVAATAWEWGFGLVPLDDEPDGMMFGTNPKTIPVNAEYLDPDTMKISLTTEYGMLNPDVTQTSPTTYLMTEGHRSVQINLLANN